MSYQIQILLCNGVSVVETVEKVSWTADFDKLCSENGTIAHFYKGHFIKTQVYKHSNADTIFLKNSEEIKALVIDRTIFSEIRWVERKNSNSYEFYVGQAVST